MLTVWISLVALMPAAGLTWRNTSSFDADLKPALSKVNEIEVPASPAAIVRVKTCEVMDPPVVFATWVHPAGALIAVASLLTDTMASATSLVAASLGIVRVEVA